MVRRVLLDDDDERQAELPESSGRGEVEQTSLPLLLRDQGEAGDNETQSVVLATAGLEYSEGGDDIVSVAAKKRRMRALDELDDDDYALVEENTGARIRSDGLRRLTKKSRLPEVAAAGDGADAEQALEEGLFGGASIAVADDEPIKREGLSRAEDSAAEKDREINDEEDDDFIEYAEGEMPQRRAEGVSAEVAEMREEAEAIFGTLQEVQELLDFTTGAAEEQGEEGPAVMDDEGESEENDFIVSDEDANEVDEASHFRRAEKRAARKGRADAWTETLAPGAATQRLASMYDLATLRLHFQTDADEAVRETDLPERLQLEFGVRAPPLTKELEQEADFILKRLFLAGLSPLPVLPRSSLTAEAEDEKRTARCMKAMESILSKMREGELTGGEVDDGERAENGARRLRLEGAFIQYFRKEDYRAAFPDEAQSPHLIRAIVDLDHDYNHLQLIKEQVFRTALSKLGQQEEKLHSVRRALRSARSPAEAQDAAAQIAQFLPAGFAEDALSSAPHAENSSSFRGKRPAKRGLLTAARRGRADVLAEKFGLSVDELVANRCTHLCQQKHLPLDQLISPVEAAQDFIDASPPHPPSASYTGSPTHITPAGELGMPIGALAAAREVYAHALASHAELRRLARSQFENSARLEATATPKGREEIDPSHPLYRVVDELHDKNRLLSDIRPGPGPYVADTLRRAVPKAELVLLLEKAANQGLFEVNLVLPDPDSVAFCDQLYECFASHVDAGVTDEWNEQRKLIVTHAMVDVLYPHLSKESMESLVTEAQAALAAECATRMRAHAMAPPYRIANAEFGAARRSNAPWHPSDHSTPHYDRKPRAVGACVLSEPDRGGVQKGGLHLAALDENGELIDRIQCRWLLQNIRARAPASCAAACTQLEVERKMGELSRLEVFFRETGCEVIALGACDLLCRRLKEELEHISFAMALRTTQQLAATPASQIEEIVGAYYRVGRPLQDQPMVDFPTVDRVLVEPHMPFRCVLVDETVPVLWAATAAARAEHAELTPELRTALASARTLQDPFLETCHALVATGLPLHAFPLHPLMPVLPEAALSRALSAELVDIACKLGVDVADAMGHEHRSHSLQFVPGLGPRKAAALMRSLQARASMGKPIESREALRDLLGACVWHNACAFLRFTTAERAEDPRRAPGLEGCRIHPESYVHASKMAFDAMFEDMDEEPTHERNEEAIERAMQFELDIEPGSGHRERPHPLQELELEEFAEYLATEGSRSGINTLRDICAELIHPFRDCRGSCEPRGPLDAERLFELLTSESTKSTLAEGSLVSARYTRFEEGRILGNTPVPGKLHVVLQSGLPGYIEEHEISNSFTKVETDSANNPVLPIEEGQMISMKVLRVHVDTFCVEGSCKADALKSARYLSLAQLDAEQEARRKQKSLARQYQKRRIGHPLFKNGTLEQVIKVLAAAPVGEVLFRPSSKGTSHLTGSVKLTANGTILHVDIKEEDKPSVSELGASLFIGRDDDTGEKGERFDDLDEICARYVEPLVENVRFLTGHRRAFHGSLDKVESALREEKSVNPSLIPYKLTATAKYPDYYLLCYMPSQRMKKEYIKVTPAGYSYRQQVFDSIEKLLQYFKLHYKEKSQPPQPRWPRRQRPAPIAEQQSRLAHRSR